MIRHAGLVAQRQGGYWRGALIEGPSGSGKSDLALRLIALGFRLVADDRTVVFVSGGRLFGRAPAPLAGLMEVRGVGVVAFPSLPLAEIVLLVACAARPADPPRSGGERREQILGLDLPRLDLWPLEPSAPVKLRRALEELGAVRQRGYQAAGS
jgi:serine kinase of HPr protein (carbohydrate metabolism regulator)